MDIAVDVDGTICTHAYPQLGDDIGAAPVLQRLVKAGHRIIVNTMRCDAALSDALAWFRKHEIPVYGVHKHPTQARWTSSPKCYAHIYLDDAALGAPLIYPDGGRPYYDWLKAARMLEERGIL